MIVMKVVTDLLLFHIKFKFLEDLWSLNTLSAVSGRILNPTTSLHSRNPQTFTKDWVGE